jgi:hypothetical protein
MKRNNLLSTCAFALALSFLLCVSMSAQSNNAAQTGVITKSDFSRAVQFAVSPPLRDLISSQPVSPFGYHEASPVLKPKLQKQLQFAAQRAQAGIQSNSPVQALAPVTATVGVNVLGVGLGFHGYTVPDAPTDSNGASGDWPGNQANAQVVEWVNVSYAVFNKATGAYLAGPILGNTLWSSLTGSQCATNNSGDIVVQFDKTHHRWILFQPAFSAPYASCFAVSTSPDALGTYNLYQFPQVNGFPDYPKLGIMPDAIYQSQNIFGTSSYIGAQPCAYNLLKMLVADPTAEQICTLDTSNGSLFDDSMLPADLDSPELPLPAGTPEVYVGSIDNFASETNIYMYTYAVNFTTLSATLTCTATSSAGAGTCPIATGLPAFVGLCGFGSSGCIPQLGVSTGSGGLDSLGDRLMYRLALRRTVNAANVPVNHWMVSHAIVNGATGAARWYEFRSPNSNLTGLAA